MMRRILTSTAMVGFTVSRAFSQGAIDVGNNFGPAIFRAPIFGAELPDPWLPRSGQPNSPPAFPLGNTIYTGPRLAGAGYSFGFYASTTGITANEESLSLIGTLGFGTGGSAGFVTTTTMNIPGVAAGNPTTYQIRVWDNNGGTVTSWAQIASPGFSGPLAFGKSALVNSGPLGGMGPGGPLLNATTTGWQSFNIYPSPEPGTWALVGLGVTAAIVIRRRK